MNTLTWLVTIFIIITPHVSMHIMSYYGLVKNPGKWPDVLLIIAGVIYPVARLLPEPSITPESITLLQHFVGGGFISTLYFIYFIRQVKVVQPLAIRLVALYFFTSGMGVANELLEFTATKIGLHQLDGSDVWWDLVANTLGAFTLYAIILLCKKTKSVLARSVK